MMCRVEAVVCGDVAAVAVAYRRTALLFLVPIILLVFMSRSRNFLDRNNTKQSKKQKTKAVEARLNFVKVSSFELYNLNSLSHIHTHTSDIIY